MLAKNINGARFSKNLTWALLALSPIVLMGNTWLVSAGCFHKGPVIGSTLGGIVAVSAAAFDNLPILGVQFSVDGSPIGAEITAAPYTASWNSSLVSNGFHRLSSGCARCCWKPATATISISVNNAPSQVVSITMDLQHELDRSPGSTVYGNDHGNDQHSRILVNQPGGGRDHSAGLYSAPAMITSTQNVTVKATSLADSTKTATAVVRLSPTVSITLGPANASLAAFQNQQFTATVLGASNPAAAWSISPAVGTITSGGLYTAPARSPALRTSL